MAKTPSKVSGNAKVKFRVFEFEMDGSDESIQDTMKTLAAALTRGGHGSVPVTRRLKPDAAAALAGAAAEADADDESTDEEDENHVEDAIVKPTSERKASAPRKPPVVKVLPGISFTDVEPTLKAFYESKNPGKNITANYLVVAYWYKNHRGIEDLTADHFHTAFRQVGFNTPRNAMQPIRDLRNSRDGRMMGGTAPGTSAIHHLGENYVNDMNKAGD